MHRFRFTAFAERLSEPGTTNQTQTNHPRSSTGWSLEFANLHGPCGYDVFGYSWRSRKGTVFNDSKGKHYAKKGYGQGDTIGCLIDLPEDLESEEPVNAPNYLGTTYKDSPLVKVKNFLYFETKDNLPECQKSLRPLKGSTVSWPGFDLSTVFLFLR